jgi:small subunit ribosomal protein S17
MADEEKNETTEETQAEEPQEETPKEVDAPAGGGDETASDDADAAAEDASPGDGEDASPVDSTPEERESDTGDDDELDWKARKRLERSRQSGEAGPQRTPEERASERAKLRSEAIKSRSAYRRKRREGREKGEGTAPAEHESAGTKERRGLVVSNKADKTITVQINLARRHPTYEKIVRNSRRLHVHDERNEANEGDLVRVVETRPLSRSKRWRLVEILEKAK